MNQARMHAYEYCLDLLRGAQVPFQVFTAVDCDGMRLYGL